MDQRVQRIIAELFLPVIGVLFWQWNTSFLLWFMVLDGLTSIVVGQIHPVRRNSWGQTLLQCVECVMVMWLILAISFSIKDSFMDFFFYEDAGFPQGYFLLPMIVLGEWLKGSSEKKMGVYFFQTKNTMFARIATIIILFAANALGLQDFYLSLLLIFLSLLVILMFPRDVFVI